MNSNKFIRTLSLLLSIISAATLFYINNQIAVAYIHADGKTKAMFGIIELFTFNYKYLILIPVTLSMILLFMLVKAKDFKILDMLTFLIGLVTIICTVTSSWKLLT